MNNLIYKTDSYKPSHSKLYRPNTTYMQSYYESRCENEDIVFFGLQYLLKKYLIGKVVTQDDVEEAKSFFEAHFGRNDVFDYEGWSYIANELDGHIPIRIYAQKEGSIHPSRTPLMVVESTDEKVFWVVNYLETLLCQIWYSITVATNSKRLKDVVTEYMIDTTDYEEEELNARIPFKVHDFGYRGVSSESTAGIGGMAHLTSFLGTDTLRAIEYAQEFYGPKDNMFGFSIPATEHSTMTSWGGKVGEMKAMENLLDTYSDGLIACVSDSYDIMQAVKFVWSDKLKKKLLSRDGTLVIRPDSGDPVITTEKVFEALWKNIGGEETKDGYRILDPHVRIIQGDGIDLDMVKAILENFKKKKISAENIAFGSGGGLLQKFDRDTFKFAFKCNMVISDGKEIDVRKKPMEFDVNGNYVQSNKWSKAGDLRDTKGLQLVFENGKLIREYTFDNVRNILLS